MEEVTVGKGRKLKDGESMAVLTIGPVGTEAAKAIAETEAAHPELTIAHYDMRFLKPLDDDLLDEVGRKFKRIVTVEDGVRSGGMGSAVMEWMADHGYEPHIDRLGLPDSFVEHGTVQQLRHLTGIDTEGIKKHLA